MRNKYTKEFEDFIKENINKYTKEELRQLIQDKYNIQISGEALRRYLNRHRIKGKYTNYKEYNVRNVHTSPVGSEHITTEGTVLVKVAQPDKWRRKARVVYEKYHNCKLKSEDYIVFLNQDKNDFRKENLMKSSKREIAYLRNNQTFSTNPRLTELGIISARLMIKAKED